jgi:hypothetical protein
VPTHVQARFGGLSDRITFGIRGNGSSAIVEGLRAI